MSVDIRPDHLQIVREILDKHLKDCQIWVYGSRATGKARKASDLDLCIKGKAKMPFLWQTQLLDDFSESNLPYKVDLIDWHNISDNFKKIVERDKVTLP